MDRLIMDGWGAEIETRNGTFTVDGYRTTDYRLQETAEGPWDDDTDGPENVMDTIKNAHDSVEQQGDDNNQGYMPSETGAWLYVPTAHWGDVTREDYESDAADEPLIDRIERKYPHLQLRNSGVLDSDEAVMV
ncbi:MAG: bacteriocin, partial [Natronomonas sp.]